MTSTARVRLSPAERRTQLLDLGVRLLATRSLDELSIDVLAEEAGISRGLLYHYFGNKQDFHEAVVRHAADDLIRTTAPQPHHDPLVRLGTSLAGYVDYVLANFAGYLSLVRGAASGNETVRAIYDEVRAALTDRFFVDGSGSPELLPDTPTLRLLLRGWQAMAEEMVIAWIENPGDLTREDLLDLIGSTLLGVVGSAGVDLPSVTAT